ncbi:dnaJ homolog subfamily C member 1-like [Branchiostoma floridae]|uniref:DnaJ homolog subfamily C member 1-like n=2 Tax=Branchiostoma floridae TaxID=7739 RepID=A0A9J7N432_BRAFL|nr:dnaJ homolog subfamily C member 1-like [Branchiostoma floridae]
MAADCSQSLGFSLLLTIFLLPSAFSWDTKELELFDLVEEVNQNFYEVLGLDQSASMSDIRRSYRKLALQMHPDKVKGEGSAEDAEERFRKLVAVSEVLRDEDMRKKYDEILVTGLPDWRTPVYYYRRVRKLSLVEMSVFLLVILTIGHYLVAWSIYFERRFELMEIAPKRRKKNKKGKKEAETEDSLLESMPEEIQNKLKKPEFRDLLPLALGRGAYWLIFAIPETYRSIQEARLEEQKRREEEERILKEEEEERKKPKEPKVRRRPKPEIPQYDMSGGNTEILWDSAPTISIDSIEADLDSYLDDEPVVKKKNVEWTEDELSQLAKSMAKFPGGTAGRWEKIAAEVGRPVSEVTTQAAKVKSNKFTVVQGKPAPGSVPNATKINQKGKGISDDIISTRDTDETDDINAFLSGDGLSQGRGRKSKKIDSDVAKTDGKKKSKSDKNVDRTALIPGAPKVKVQNGREERVAAENKSVSDAKSILDASAHMDSGAWSQKQQKQLETAIAQHPKGTAERWEKIAEMVPGKGKEDCMLRYKELVERVRKKKQTAEKDTADS